MFCQTQPQPKEIWVGWASSLDSFCLFFGGAGSSPVARAGLDPAGLAWSVAQASDLQLRAYVHQITHALHSKVVIKIVERGKRRTYLVRWRRS